MTTATPFTPKWASAPGRTIRSRMNELGLDSWRLGGIIEQPQELVERLLSGSEPISPDLAGRLATALGASPEFWFTRERQYRESLDRLESDQWLEGLPLRAMVRAGWLPEAKDRLRQGLDFFNVSTFNEWKMSYRPMLAQSLLRVGARSQVQEPALAAWLHRATLLANQQPVPEFDGSTLKIRQDQILRLTRKRDPQTFLPELRDLLASAGVAFVVLPTLPGSPVNGASRVLGNGSAMLAVSGRYLADDQLWFTVFHEIAHLVLHSSKGLFLDDLSLDAAANNQDEQEANLYAANALLPEDINRILPPGILTYRDIIRAAQTAGISPGILVGQLQFAERIGPEQFNKAKRRYRWDGAILKNA